MILSVADDDDKRTPKILSGEGCHRIGRVDLIQRILEINHAAVKIYLQHIHSWCKAYQGNEIQYWPLASIVAGFLKVMIAVGPEDGGDIGGYVLVLMGSVTYSIMFN